MPDQRLEEFARKIERITVPELERGEEREDERVVVPPPHRFRKILVAYDGSRGARDALAWARWLAAGHEARIVLALVLPPAPRILGGGLTGISTETQGTINALIEDQAVHGARMLEDAKKSVEQDGIACEAEEVQGRPSHELVRLAELHDPDLVVAGSHKKRGLERVLLGSVSWAVAERAPGSVLVVRTPPPATTALLAVDGSQLSYEAAATMLALPEQLREARVVHVLPLPFAAFTAAGREVMEDVLAEVNAAVRRKLETGDQVVDQELLYGKPARRILELADVVKPGLIVMGARGHTRLRDLLMGSVSSQVVHRAKTNVLLVRQRVEPHESATR